MARIEHVNLVVKDLDATVDFIQTAFPDWKVRQKGQGILYDRTNNWLHIGSDEHYITLNQINEVSDLVGGSYETLAHVGFEVGDVDALSERLKNKGYAVTTIGADHPHRKNIYFLEPGGIEFEFVQYKSDVQEERNLYGGETSDIQRITMKDAGYDRRAFVQKLYRVVDARDVNALGNMLAEGVLFKIGNMDDVVGKEAVLEANKGFFTSIAGMVHTIENVWSQGDDVICHGHVDYTRLDGTNTSATFSTILKLKDELIVDYRVFADVSAL